MTSYASLALLYDDLMSEVDHTAWGNYIDGLIRHFGAPGRSLLDVGCGTGTITIKLQQLGYDVLGIDMSSEMLAIAANKGLEVGLGIDSWLSMDMRALQSPQASFAIAVCACDGVNYLGSNDELDGVFAGLRQALCPGGLLLFDVHTLHKMQHIFPSGPFVQESAAGYCIWSSQYDASAGNATHDLTLFIHEEGELWRRFEETHIQHYFAPDVIRHSLASNGFELLSCQPWGQKTGGIAPGTERLQYVARRQ